MLSKFVVLALCIGWCIAASNGVNVRSDPRSSSVPIPQTLPQATNTNSNDQDSGSKSAETVVGPVTGVFGGYSGSQGQTAFQSQPTALNGYTGYSLNGPNSYPQNNQIFGVSSNGDLTLSAYFGPVFWGFISGLGLGIIVVWIINLVGGFEYLGSTIRGIETDYKKTGAGKAKALDLDRLATLVYDAMDKYNKWNK